MPGRRGRAVGTTRVLLVEARRAIPEIGAAARRQLARGRRARVRHGIGHAGTSSSSKSSAARRSGARPARGGRLSSPSRRSSEPSPSDAGAGSLTLGGWSRQRRARSDGKGKSRREIEQLARAVGVERRLRVERRAASRSGTTASIDTLARPPRSPRARSLGGEERRGRRHQSLEGRKWLRGRTRARTGNESGGSRRRRDTAAALVERPTSRRSVGDRSSRTGCARVGSSAPPVRTVCRGDPVEGATVRAVGRASPPGRTGSEKPP